MGKIKIIKKKLKKNTHTKKEKKNNKKGNTKTKQKKHFHITGSKAMSTIICTFFIAWAITNAL